MSKQVISAHPNTEIRLVARVLVDERIGALPIVNDNEELVGMITRTDILRAMVKKAPLELWI